MSKQAETKPRVTPMRGGGRGMSPGNARKPVSASATIKRLLRYITGPYRWLFLLVAVCILFSAGAGVAGSLFLQTLIDDYITPLLSQAVPDFSGLLRAILVMAAIYLAGVVTTFLYNFFMVTISQGVQKKIRDQLFSGMQKLPIKYFDTHTHGDIMSHYTNDIDTLRMMLSQSIPQTLSSIVTVICVFCAMVYISIPLTILVLLSVTGMTFLGKKIAGKSSKYFIKQQRSLGDVNGYIEEMIEGQKVIKVFCHEEETKAKFDAINQGLCETATEANTYSNIMGPVFNNLGHLQYALVAILGGVLAISGIGGMTLGGLASFLQLSRSFSQPINQVMQQFNSIVMALAGAERIFKLMDEEPEEDDGYVELVNAKRGADGTLTETKERTHLWAWKHPHGDGTVTYTELNGDVRFFDVNFGYTPKKIVLHDINIYANPGEKIALVGATGAGKTTITNLINRFYDIQNGKIRYDGINITKIKKADLRRSLGIVLQDTHLFTETIRENIRYGRLDATDEEVVEAAKRANAHDFITMLPDGYDTEISGDGSDLSQGQRQLLSIARAAIADPPVMILDEATSSIDTRTEAIVQRGMDQLMQGRTVFVIAHRLSTVKNSDVIMVLELGHIIERGDHESLIADGGKYYQLYTGAFELE